MVSFYVLKGPLFCVKECELSSFMHSQELYFYVTPNVHINLITYTA